ncbi:hypothetical protein [Burkholderia ubonensis]|uniref:Uncharacterized protein n=1 Tax=Burkholderia ubonensis subsp. mesacidophila TaxID=265293 RepID=A0A2A4FJA4_9BURK|nr:hypothetical protein [Burkholderia ubonensis]PCE33157.1 hypothetical protein BZL54_07355 [Burkholderia ubonensis subsp. mesacidophila]
MALDPANGFPRTPPAYAEHAGDANRQAAQFALDLDAAMRVNYAANIERIGENIYPLLYAEATFDGGRYTLQVDDHTTYAWQDIDLVYEQAKAIAHVPLGIFSILSGYGMYSRDRQWQPALQAYLEQVRPVLQHLGQLSLVGFAKSASHAILTESIRFMESTLSSGAFTLDGFSAYARPLADAIQLNMSTAAASQVATMSKVLDDWKAALGEARWDQLYVVVSALWTLSRENAHELIIKATMKPERRETNVIVSEAVPTLAAARNLLGRIVGDRVMAEQVFDPNGKREQKEDIYSLSTRRDLLSQAVESILRKNRPSEFAAGCPHVG